jgi:triosephosphate isomerase
MRRTLFIGNWKAHNTVAEAEAFFKELPQYSGSWTHEVVLTPPFTCMETAQKMLPPNVILGAQDVSHYGIGHYCGEIPCALLKPFGVKFAIVGHVERRIMGEENSRINIKLKNCLAHDITPVLCVGDTMQEFQSNRTREVIEKQLKECLVGVSDLTKIVIAYQPIWSIGTGHYASSELCGMIAGAIRKAVQKIGGTPMAGNFPILFAGGITTGNAREYLEAPDIDGLMVGPTSLKPSTFSEIVTTKFEMQKHNQE